MDKAQEKIAAFIKGEIQSYTCTVCNDCARAMTNKIVGKMEELGYRKPPDRPELRDAIISYITKAQKLMLNSEILILADRIVALIPDIPKEKPPEKERHLITIYPDMKFGEPTIDHRRFTVEHVAGKWWGGWTLEDLGKPWPDMSRGAVLVSCWYMARYGSRTWRKRWKEWLEVAEGELWHGKYKTCPMPPQSSPSPKG